MPPPPLARRVAAPVGPEPAVQVSLAGGIVWFRWVAWVWMVMLIWFTRAELQRPGVAWAVIGATLVFTAVTSVWARSAPLRLVDQGVAVGEVVLGSLVALSGGWAYRSVDGTAFGRTESLGWAWPLAGILAVGVSMGPWAGAASGLAVAAGRAGAPIVGGATARDVIGTGLGSTTLLFMVGGALAGYVSERLRTADRQLADARARDEVARTLHDGVLQTLAVFERRAEPDLATLARRTERELREYLFGAGTTAEKGGAAELGPSLRDMAARIEDTHDIATQVVLAPDLPPLARLTVTALVGAVGEAFTNAAKHGAPQRITVYAEPDDADGVICTVHDNGTGFDPDTVVEGIGIRSSIRARIDEVGGTVDIVGRPGAGTDVRIWVP
jgi:signal transduction histidine kinase